MVQLSKPAEAALILHNAQKAVSARSDGSWWLLDQKKWEFISSLPAGPEHTFVLAVIHAHNERRFAALK